MGTVLLFDRGRATSVLATQQALSSRGITRDGGNMAAITLGGGCQIATDA
jgi:hypothetical protein